MAQPVLPQKKSLPIFLYASDGLLVIDVQPDSSISTSTAIEAAEIISLSGSVLQTGSYWHPSSGQVTVVTGKPHDPTYTDAASLALLGISVGRDPINHWYLQDQAGDLTVEDRTVYADTFAGNLRRFPVLVGEGIVLVKFWNTVANQAATLAATDVGKTAYASITDGTAGTTGKSGYATIDTGAAAKVPIGTIVAVPIVGDQYAYIKFEPSRAR